MRRGGFALALGFATLGLASAALGFSPGPNNRILLLPLGSCEGGEHDGDPCIDDADCEDAAAGGVCSTELADVAVRGVLTLIADKDSAGFDDVTPVPQGTQKIPVPTDLTKSTLTVMLEFTRNGERFALTETYQDLGDYLNPALSIDCKGFCVPTWREPAVEARIASVESGVGGGGTGGGGGGGGGVALPGVRIQWAPGGAAMQQALIEALGLPAGSVAFLEVVSDTERFDHSQEADLLATVRRMKVTIRAILPAGAP
jgi:hypothetical protein